MSLLIDVKIITNKKLSNIEKLIMPILQNKKYQIGVIFKSCVKSMEILRTKPSRESKLLYFNSDEFVKTIESYCYVCFDKKVCILTNEALPMLKDVVYNTMRYLPNNLILKIENPPKKSYDILKKQGFVADSNNIFTRVNNEVLTVKDEFLDKQLYNDLNRQYKFCKTKCKFSTKTFKFMKKLPFIGSSPSRNGNITQKELAGSMFVNYIDNENISIIDIKSSSIVSGGEHTVSTSPDLITFHTHPQSAYLKYKVKNGWPSVTDYETFLKACSQCNLMFHVVVAVEGIYVISRPEIFIKENASLKLGNIIRKHEAMCKKTDKSPIWHCEQISNIKVNNVQIIKVEFLEWGKPIDTFTVFHHKEYGKCNI